MNIYLDTAVVEDIKKYIDFGVVKGVTTNPSLIAATGANVVDRITEISNIVDGPVSVEVSALSTTADEMIKEGVELSKINKNIVIKIPMTLEGLKAVTALTKLNIKTNVTLIFNTNQAILASLAGATYVSPFVGRLNDISNIGLNLIEEISAVFDIHGIETEIISASIRSVDQVFESFLRGAHIVTIPVNILEQMSKHPLTDSGIQRFKEDHIKVFGNTK